MNAATPRRVGRTRRIAFALIALASLGFSGRASAQAENERINETRLLLEKWMENQTLIQKERDDWRLGKQILNDRIELITRRIAQTKGQIAEFEEKIRDTEEKKSAALEAQTKLQAANDSLREIVVRIEGKLRGVVKRLPKPLLTPQFESLIKRLPEDSANTDIPLRRRYEAAMAILTLTNKFNRQITVTTDSRDLGGGKKALVTVMYLGLGHAYYVSEEETENPAAGIGVPGSEGWVWTRADASAEAIATAIAVYRNQKPPAYVRLPVRIR